MTSGQSNSPDHLFSLLMPGIPALSMTRVPGGHSHESWLVTTAGDQYLLKLCRRHNTWGRLANTIFAHELTAAHNLPVPKIIAAAEEHWPQLCYVQEFIPGLDAETAWPRLSTGERQAVGFSLGQSIARLHLIPGGFFADDTRGVKKHSSWPSLCKQKLLGLTRANEEASVIRQATLRQAVVWCSVLIEELTPGIAPALTHRDLYLSNVVVDGGEFKAIIDLEGARFYDPLWDFVKLEMWGYRSFPDLVRPFMSGYESVRPWQPDFETRIDLYRGLEYLSGIPYFTTRYPDPRMQNDFTSLLEQWLELHP